MQQQNPTPLPLFLVGVAERKEKLSDQTDLFFLWRRAAAGIWCFFGGGLIGVFFVFIFLYFYFHLRHRWPTQMTRQQHGVLDVERMLPCFFGTVVS